MDTGSIEWISEQKGFGFITPDNGHDDLYVPISEIQGLSQARKSASTSSTIDRQDA